jgi:hypothetical protein
MGLFQRIADYFTSTDWSELEIPVGETDDEAFAKTDGPTKPVGTGGQSYYGGYLSTNERNPEMQGAAKWRFFEDAKRNVESVGLGLRIFLVLGGTPDWHIKPWKKRGADEPTPEDKERAEWLEDSLNAMATPWKTCVMVGLLSSWDGFSLQGWWLKHDNMGRLAPADVAWREPQTIERYEVDEDGTITAVFMRSPQTQQEIRMPRDRLVWHRDLPITGSPEGIGILRHLAESVKRLKKLEQMLAKGFEKDVNQTPILYGPVSERLAAINTVEGDKVYTKADFDKEFEGVVKFADAAVRKGSAIVLDSKPYEDAEGKLTNVPKWKADVLTATMASADALSAEIRRVSWNVLAMAGLEFLLLGADGAGSLAMSIAKMQNALRVISMALNMFAETIRRDFFREVWRWNGWDPDTAPSATWDGLELKDVASVVQSLSALLTAAGVEAGRADHIVDEVLEHLGLSPLKDRDDDDMVLRREEAMEMAGLGPKKDDEDEDDEED